MKMIFVNEFKQNRRILIIWSVILFLTAALGGVEFGGLQSNFDVLMTAVNGMPRIVRLVFGIDAVPLNTPLGQYICMYYWYAVIAFCYAAYLGVFVIAKDERYHTAEFIYTKPFKRNQIVTVKLLVAAVNMAIIAVLSAIGSIIFLLPVINGMDLVPQVITTTIGMFITQIVFVAIGMFCSALTSSYKKGLILSFTVLILAYVIAFAIEYAGTVNFLNFISPVRYFNSPDVAQNGLSLLYLLLSGVISAIALYVTFVKHGKRDLHA